MTRDGDLAVVVRAMQVLVGGVAAGKDRANTAEAWIRETWNKLSEFPGLVKGMSPTFGGERAHVGGLLMRGWYQYGRSSLQRCRGMKELSAGRNVTCVTVSSRGVF